MGVFHYVGYVRSGSLAYDPQSVPTILRPFGPYDPQLVPTILRPFVSTIRNRSLHFVFFFFFYFFRTIGVFRYARLG